MNPSLNRPLSVSEISLLLKEIFSHSDFQSLKVYGEVYSLKRGKFSYIDLGDQGHNETSSPLLRCAFSTFYYNNIGLDDVKVGDVIEIEGSLSYYPHGSSITFWGKKVTLLKSQLGKNLLEKRESLEKLDKLGYLDPRRKKPIPKLVKKVAILTAINGAAIEDIRKTLSERYPCERYIFPTVVQGEGAAKSMIRQLKRAIALKPDCIILGRGGGSKTDLSCFDDYNLAITIAESPVPIITCIGHTIDTAIADRVSDFSCITPTEGASQINPSLKDIKDGLNDSLERIKSSYESCLNREYMTLSQLSKRLESLSPLMKVNKEKEILLNKLSALNNLYKAKLNENVLSLDHQKEMLESSMVSLIDKEKSKLSQCQIKLSSINPEKLASLGYALILKDGKRVIDSKVLKKDDKVIITYTDSRKEAIITKE